MKWGNITISSVPENIAPHNEQPRLAPNNDRHEHSICDHLNL